MERVIYIKKWLFKFIKGSLFIKNFSMGACTPHIHLSRRSSYNNNLKLTVEVFIQKYKTHIIIEYTNNTFK